MTKTAKTTVILFFILLLATLFFAFPIGTDEKAFADGEIEINTVEDLIDLAESVNAYDRNRLGETFVLTADLDLTGVDIHGRSFSPIGTTSEVNHSVNHVFHGTFYGGGHTVTVELDGYFKNAFIGNLGSNGKVYDLTVQGSITGAGYAAGIVADNSGAVENCINKATITNTADRNSFTGGITGYNNGRIISCVNFATVNSSFRAGGIAGYVLSSSSLNSCVNFGKVSATSTESVMQVGGIAGEALGSIKNCYSYAEVYVNPSTPTEKKHYVGYLAGSASETSSENNYFIKKTTDMYSDLDPVWNAHDGVAGKFEQKTLYDFLKTEGVVFGNDSTLKRAYFGTGYGYFYAPDFLTEEIDEKICVVGDYDETFKISLFSLGSGETDDPFVITTIEEWDLFASNTRITNYDGKFIKLNADLSVGNNFVANSDTPFSGEFDGNGKKITVSVNSISSSNIALFTYVNGCTVKNLTVRGSLRASEGVAGVIANASGSVILDNVKNSCDVTGKSYLGGLIARSSDAAISLTACVNDGDVTCTYTGAKGKAGGLLGSVSGSMNIAGAYNYGTVSSEISSTYYVGGICGYAEITQNENGLKLSSLHNEGSVSAIRSYYVGGLFGKLASIGEYKVALESVSVFSSTVGKFYVGGIIGEVTGTVGMNTFAVIGGVKGDSFVSGVTGVGGTDGVDAASLTLEYGYYTGVIAENSTSTVEEFASDVIANARQDGLVSFVNSVFYNEDDCNKDTVVPSVERKNGIQLTGGVFDGGFFHETLPDISEGKYPYPILNADAIRKSGVLNLSYFDGKDTTNGTYYVLASEQALRNFAYFCNTVSTYRGYNYRLKANVTLTRPFIEIPTFSGVFDGNGYKIYGYSLTSDPSSSEVGFFNVLDGATVQKLRIESGELNCTAATYAGSICGHLKSGAEIGDSYSAATITGTATYAGGLVGLNESNISGCFYIGKIFGENVNYAGGIAGRMTDGEIENCFVNGKIYSKANAGGIVGQSEGGSIRKCYVSGRVEGLSNAVVGGIIARAANTSVREVVVYSELVGNNAVCGFFAVTDGTTSSGVSNCFYYSDMIPADRISAYPGVGNANEQYAKDTDYFRLSGSGYFSAAGFTAIDSSLKTGGKFNEECDSYYSSILTYFLDYILENSVLYDEDVAYYVKNSVELFIFGRDTSSDRKPGSANNPYVIKTATQFASLYELTKWSNFAGKYFFIANDIDMNDSQINLNGNAIGYYNASGTTEGFPFCGVVYGDAANRPTVSNVYINKSSTSRTGTTYSMSYLGVFANVESGFVLRDIIFTGSVSGNSYNGGLVGYGYDAVIENCLSYIDVTSVNAGAGGLVGVHMGNLTITNSICAGRVTAESEAYGLVGEQSVRSVTDTGSWFVVSEANYENYVHNNCGSILTDCSDPGNGLVFIITSDENGFGFTTTSTTQYKGHILDSNDGYIAPCDETIFYSSVGGSEDKFYYCVRFCIQITAEVELPGGSSGTAYAEATSDSYSYIGGNTSIQLVWQDAGKETGYKFVTIKDKNGTELEFELKPSAGSIIVSFVMTEDSDEVRLVINRITEGDIFTFEKASGTRYDGTVRTPVLFEGGTGDLEFYLKSTEERKTEIKDAGEYRIVLNLTNGSDYIGLYETVYSVGPALLGIQSKEALSTDFFKNTVYDSTTQIRTYTFLTSDPYMGGAITGAIEGEEVTVRLTFTYGQQNAGTGISLTLTSAEVTDGNYEFGDVTAFSDLGDIGVINKKTIHLAPEYDYVEEIGNETYYVMERSYAGDTRKPVIAGVYEINIAWRFNDELGNEVSVYSAGDYYPVAVMTNASDENNYEFTTDEMKYLMRIKPYVISTFDYGTLTSSGVEFTGSSLRSEIEHMVTFDADIGSGLHSVELLFYETVYAETPIEGDIINAGNYYVFPVPVNTNFAADESLERTQITIRKKTVGAPVIKLRTGSGYLQNGNSVVTETIIELDLSDDELTQGGVSLFDGEYRVNRNNYFRTEKSGDKWYIIPTAGGNNINFTITGQNATNYNDRTSATFVLSIEKKEIYAILDNDTFYYGDDIESELFVNYFYVGENGEVGESIDRSKITGRDEPSIVLVSSGRDVGEYEIMFSSGGSDGYTFSYYSNAANVTDPSAVNKIFILPKPIFVIVSNAGSKTYGEENENISYALAYPDPVSGTPTAFTALPDGRTVVLNGKIGREAGENVGEYELNADELKNLNPNYSITENFGSRFTIVKRNLGLEITDGQGKEYGEADGTITLSVMDGYELVRSERLDIFDDMSLFDNVLSVTREAGEEVGGYAYSVFEYATALSTLNYNVWVDENSVLTQRYTIRGATPILNFALIGKAYFGDNVSDLQLNSSAVNKRGEEIDGRFNVYVFDLSAEGRRRYTLRMTDRTLYAEFVPYNHNYVTYTTNISITVAKRPVTVVIRKADEEDADVGVLTYKGVPYKAVDFTCEIIGAVAGSTDFDTILTIDGDSLNVTEEGFTISAFFSVAIGSSRVNSLVTDYYVLTGETSARYTISKSKVTVKVADASISVGETYSPKITYSGFLGNDDESSVTTKATVSEAPKTAGYHSVTASGAQARNYDFIYEPGVLTVNKTSETGEGITISGSTLAPNFSVTTETFKEGASFEDVESIYSSALGGNVLLPLSVKMKEYVKIEAGKLSDDEEYEYTVRVSDLKDGDKLYAAYNDGKIKEISYTAEKKEDGYYVTFKSKRIDGVAVYEKKDVKTLLLGYLPLGCIVLGVIVIIVLIIVFSAVGRKKRKKEAERYEYYRANWK